MKVLIVATTDTGGAGIASLRLMKALRSGGTHVRMLVLRKESDDDSVFEWIQPYVGYKRKFLRARQLIQQYISAKSIRNLTRGRSAGWDAFTPPAPALLSAKHPLVDWADVVHLHWCAQFWDWHSLHDLCDKALFWTFHDLNPITGGCHYPGDCQQFTVRCSRCPQLEGARNPGVVKGVFEFKRRMLQRGKFTGLTVIAPSQWISNHARRSPLLAGKTNHLVIPNTFNESIFCPYDQKLCRTVFSMPHNKRIVLFAANYLENYRKGMDILISSMELLSGEKDLIFYAAGKRNQKAAGGVLSLGNITDERMMAVAYNAVDVCVVPSREDNLPNTIGESISCGTPVVGFRRGGIPEMIEDGVNGVLVDEVSALALAQGIRRSLSIAWNKNSISLSARGKYSRSVVAHSHAEAYRSASAEKRL